MDEAEFRDFYNRVISKKLLAYLRRSAGVLEYKNVGDRCRDIWSEYERYRKRMHECLDKDGKIDRHKVGAAIIAAIQISNPIHIKEYYNSKKIDLEFRIAKEMVAIESGISMVISFFNAPKYKDDDIAQQIVKQQDFTYPSCVHGVDYISFLAKMVHDGEDARFGFDCYSWAIILHNLEYYTRLHLETR